MLGDLLRRQGQFQAALERFSAGESKATSIGDPELQWQLAYGRGQTLEAIGREDDALAAYRHAVEVIESVHSQLREDRYRYGYLQDKAQVYIALVRLLLKKGKAGDAFSYAEKLRAQGTPAPFGRSTSPELAQREAELRSRVRRLQEALDQENAKGSQSRQQATGVFSAELQSAERDYQNLLDDIRMQSSRGYTPVISASQVQQLLPADGALLEYVVSSDALIIFVLTRGELQATTVSVRPEELETTVELLRDFLGHRQGSEWQGPAASLYRTLIEPVEKLPSLQGVRKLWLVPHGVLHYVPFALLAGEIGRAHV